MQIQHYYDRDECTIKFDYFCLYKFKIEIRLYYCLMHVSYTRMTIIANCHAKHRII